ncbi:uncharacterized protein, partial [Amphiura filiformis]|uniref:uncharacterized protein n=1 Tax=Amphiura filiformis TaxID=82378 RepID=UPI003B2197AA
MKSFTCCRCLRKVNGGINGLFLHLKFVHKILSSTCTKIVCGEHNCRAIFWRGSSYKRHLTTIHNNAIGAGGAHVGPAEELLVAGEIGGNAIAAGNGVGINQGEDQVGELAGEMEVNADDVNAAGNGGGIGQDQEGELLAEEIEDDEETLTDFVAAFLARMKHKSIPSSVIQDFINESKNLVETAVKRVENQFSPILASIQNGILPTEEMVTEATEALEVSKNPFSELDTEYKQRKYLLEANVLVEPVPGKTHGKVYKTRTAKQTGRNYKKPHEEAIQYVPIKENVKQFLHQPGVMSSILLQHPSDDDNILESYRDGIFFKDTFNADNQDDVPVLPFILYSDDFETGNPLGSKKGVNKLTA